MPPLRLLQKIMADLFRFPCPAATLRVAAALAVTLPALDLTAQVPEAGSYPVDPVAAAGMTSGLPNGVTGRQVEMMRVRTAAQGAQGEAAAASMARSADQSIEERNREVALQRARTNKAIKEQMRNRLRFDNAAAQQRKVTAHDMATWEQNGGVRVERSVPDAFISSLIAEEEMAAARSAESGGRKRFSLFGGDDDPDDGGFLRSIRPPRIPLPFLGGRDEAPEEAPAPAPSDRSEPVFARSGSGGGPAPDSSPSKPGMIPQISGAALVDGRAPAAADRAPEEPERISFADETPEPHKKRPGLFSMLDTGGDRSEKLVPSSSSGGFFGFGKKKSVSSSGGIDASLFPDGSADQAPRGGRLSGGATVEDVADDFASDSSSTGSFALPGQSMEKEKSRFSFPKPNLSLPSVPNLTKAVSSGGGGEATSTGSYVVSNTAQFMVYGAEQMQSEIRALPAGTPVTVTKPGEQWSGIQLSDGTEGVVQNKNLRPAGR